MARSVNYPEWLEPSAVPLTIVSGPPCSGKTTFVKQRAQPGDTVIDLDEIQASINPRFRPWTEDNSQLDQALAIRNEMLEGLAHKHDGKAWFIIGAPTQAERAWWHERLGGELFVLMTDRTTCIRRAKDRLTPGAITGIWRWFYNAETGAWAPPQTRQPIGLDGWPV